MLFVRDGEVYLRPYSKQVCVLNGNIGIDILINRINQILSDIIVVYVNSEAHGWVEASATHEALMEAYHKLVVVSDLFAHRLVFRHDHFEGWITLRMARESKLQTVLTFRSNS